MAQEKVFALMGCSNASRGFEVLKALLNAQPVETWSALSYNEFLRLLGQPDQESTLTGEGFPDDSWIVTLWA